MSPSSHLSPCLSVTLSPTLFSHSFCHSHLSGSVTLSLSWGSSPAIFFSGSLVSSLASLLLPAPGVSTSLYLPPRRPGPLFLSLCPPGRLRVTPAPCRAGTLSAVHQPCCPGQAGEFLLVPGKNNWGREKGPQSPRHPPPPSGLGVSPESAARGRKPCGFWLLPGGLRIWPPPPGQQPKYYSAGGVGGGGRRPRLKEAFRAARPGASCPQARASGRPSRDLRWPEGRGVVVGSLGEGGAIPQGV